jgi:hypothetical protein
MMAAALYTRSMGPKRSSTSFTVASTAWLSVTSRRQLWMPSRPWAVSARPASLMSTAATFAPASAMRWEASRPMPLPPPVTKTT